MATKAAPAPKAAKEKAAPNRATGKTLGLGVQATWVKLFQDNEKRGATRKTDAEITKTMNSEFPARKSKVFERVQHVRAQYNRGVLTGGEVPKTPSSRYGEDGQKTTARAGRPKATAGEKAVKVKAAPAKLVVKKASAKAA